MVITDSCRVRLFQQEFRDICKANKITITKISSNCDVPFFRITSAVSKRKNYLTIAEVKRIAKLLNADYKKFCDVKNVEEEWESKMKLVIEKEPEEVKPLVNLVEIVKFQKNRDSNLINWVSLPRIERDSNHLYALDRLGMNRKVAEINKTGIVIYLNEYVAHSGLNKAVQDVKKQYRDQNGR